MTATTFAMEAVAELSSSLAHEIRNPLASIRSSVEQLSRSARSHPDEQFLAGLIVREADRLSRLLSEFVDFSRVRVTQSRPLDLREVARAALRLVGAVFVLVFARSGEGLGFRFSVRIVPPWPGVRASRPLPEKGAACVTTARPPTPSIRDAERRAVGAQGAP
jgi:signal transduction histidine kinase